MGSRAFPLQTMGHRPRCLALALGVAFASLVACTGETTRGPSCINPQPDLPFCGSAGPGNGTGGGAPVDSPENPGSYEPNPPPALGGSFSTGGAVTTGGTGFGTGGGMASGGSGGQPANGAGGSAQGGAAQGGEGGEAPEQGGASGGDAEGGAAGDAGGGAGGDGG